MSPVGGVSSIDELLYLILPTRNHTKKVDSLDRRMPITILKVVAADVREKR